MTAAVTPRFKFRGNSRVVAVTFARPLPSGVELDNVASCGHIRVVKRKPFKYPVKGAKAPDILKEAMTVETPETMMINVRAAKDQLSSLLEQAARGNEIIITSDGQPKARLVPVKSARKPFRVDWELLRSVPPKAGAKPAEELVREDRDARP